jgi:hypothetical protein
MTTLLQLDAQIPINKSILKKRMSTTQIVKTNQFFSVISNFVSLQMFQYYILRKYYSLFCLCFAFLSTVTTILIIYGFSFSDIVSHEKLPQFLVELL